MSQGKKQIGRILLQQRALTAEQLDKALAEGGGRLASRLAQSGTISDVAALLQRADLVICNDTGVMHVACAAGARVLSIFGPTDPVRWAPRAPSLTVVRAPDGNLSALSAESVSERAWEILEAKTSAARR